MKCEIVRDLLPLYIDGITSEVSGKEIEAHLETCSECRQYYQEMRNRLPEIQPKAEADSVEIIKKAGKKRKLMKRLAISAMAAAGAVCLILGSIVLLKTPRRVKYGDVILEYGMADDKEAYVEIKPKAGKFFDVVFSGYTRPMTDSQGKRTGTTANWAVWSSNRGLGGHEQFRTTADCHGSEIAEWTLVFADKVVVIRNGELVSVEDVE